MNLKKFAKKLMRKLVFSYIIFSGDTVFEAKNNYGSYVIRIFTKNYYDNSVMKALEEYYGKEEHN